jgi:hypothetical protein
MLSLAVISALRISVSVQPQLCSFVLGRETRMFGQPTGKFVYLTNNIAAWMTGRIYVRRVPLRGTKFSALI